MPIDLPHYCHQAFLLLSHNLCVRLRARYLSISLWFPRVICLLYVFSQIVINCTSLLTLFVKELLEETWVINIDKDHRCISDGSRCLLKNGCSSSLSTFSRSSGFFLRILKIKSLASFEIFTSLGKTMSSFICD
jgi:membrane-associated HD superfamily phosphohydrolase